MKRIAARKAAYALPEPSKSAAKGELYREAYHLYLPQQG
jgi:hypothetical protein